MYTYSINTDTETNEWSIADDNNNYILLIVKEQNNIIVKEFNAYYLDKIIIRFFENVKISRNVIERCMEMRYSKFQKRYNNVIKEMCDEYVVI